MFMEVPPDRRIPSTTGLPELVAAPTEILLTLLLETLAPVPDEITIPLTVGELVMMPVKFIALIVVPVIEWAPEPPTEIPVIAVGAVAEEVSDNVLFEI